MAKLWKSPFKVFISRAQSTQIGRRSATGRSKRDVQKWQQNLISCCPFLKITDKRSSWSWSRSIMIMPASHIDHTQSAVKRRDSLSVGLFTLHSLHSFCFLLHNCKALPLNVTVHCCPVTELKSEIKRFSLLNLHFSLPDFDYCLSIKAIVNRPQV